jgi:transcription elongation factor Elf1
MWVRTCQECGHEQVMKSPKDQKTDNWRDAKCRKCGSMALDYGKEVKPKE